VTFLDAILSLLALMSFFAVLLGSVSLFNEQVIITTNKIVANNLSKECMVLIDSFFSNSAHTHYVQKTCFVQNGLVAAKKDAFVKSHEVLTTIKSTTLEVNPSEHYK
jgi:hypothetical protein